MDRFEPTERCRVPECTGWIVDGRCIECLTRENIELDKAREAKNKAHDRPGATAEDRRRAIEEFRRRKREIREERKEKTQPPGVVPGGR